MSSLKIPKIIHQIWLGDQTLRPDKLLETWKNLHPDYEYILWTEKEIKQRKLDLKLYKSMLNNLKEVNCKAEIIRWVILYEYGGYFFDADTACIKPIDEELENCVAFTSYMNEEKMPSQLSTIGMGFYPKHRLPDECLKHLLNNFTNDRKYNKNIWQTCCSMMLTTVYKKCDVKDVKIFPSYYFNPEFYDGYVYKSHGKVFCWHEWGTVRNKYDVINRVNIPKFLQTPEINVSLLLCCENINVLDSKKLLESIKNQQGMFGIEIVFIDNGLNSVLEKLMKTLLQKLVLETRNIHFVYCKNEVTLNEGVCLNKGIEMCSNEIILRMSVDSVMNPLRMVKQIEYLLNNKDVHILGAQVNDTNYKSITWETFCETGEFRFNPSTLALRKSSVLNVGNYKECENSENELVAKMIQTFNNFVNMEDVLITN